MTFRISKTAVSSIVIEICKAIWKILKEKHMPTPTIADFEKVAQEFYENWNFPNCVGSIDGKHIRIKCPKKSGSMFFNYKQFFSIVLMAVADANYKFIMIDVGSYGKDSDGGILSNSNILKRLENKTLKLPYPKKLPNSNLIGPYTFIADEAFPLRTYMMRPYPRRLLNDENKSYFNYRLSRARMTIECAFGIAAAKFRILQKSIETKVDNADHIVKAICMLHNVIIDLEKKGVANYMDSDISNQINNLSSDLAVSVRNNKTSRAAENIRSNLSIFFSNNKL